MSPAPGSWHTGAQHWGVAKAKSAYYCTGCGFESARWLGRCPSCEAWNTFEDAPVVKPVKAAQGRAVPLRSNGPMLLAAIEDTRIARRRTGMAEFDGLLGGGIVPGSLVLLGGPPGAGKSTLLLQLALGLRLRRGVGSADKAARATRRCR